jgi:predicted metalloprotease with PDZ domain
MNSRPVCRLACLGAFVFLFAARPAAATIHYKVSLKNPEQHSFQVTMTIPHPSNGMTVAIPAWNALYQVRDFAYRVRDVQASSFAGSGTLGEKLPIRKLDKQTWEIRSAQDANDGGFSSWTVRYSITWDEPGPFSSQLNSKHAFVNFAEVLMYTPDRRGEDTTVAFEDVPAGWRAATQLPAGSTPNSFSASSYDTLVDAPVEIGKFEEFGFDEGGAHFRVVVDAREWRRDRLEDSLRQITSYELKLMGTPFREYTFFFHVGPYLESGGGGMEHANCTAIGATSVEGAVTIAAHEFFHAWNVKRIRPQTLEPVDFTKEQYTRALWFAEGVTSTYAAYTLERSGIWPKERFYGDLASQISELDSRPARLWQSVEESSLDAWLEKYDDYRQPDRSISYYNKGQIVGEMLDLAIRDATDNHKSLDDVMRRMNDEYAKKGKYYDDSDGIRAVAEEVAGTSFEDFFQRYVAGTDEIPYDKFLGSAGLELKSETVKMADLGFWTAGGRSPSSAVTVSQVVPGSSAEAAGLLAGDVLLQLNGEAVPRYLAGRMRVHSPGEIIKLRVKRDTKEMDISFALGSNDVNNYSISEVSHATDKQKRIREGWLRGTVN